MKDFGNQGSSGWYKIRAKARSPKVNQLASKHKKNLETHGQVRLDIACLYAIPNKINKMLREQNQNQTRRKQSQDKIKNTYSNR